MVAQSPALTRGIPRLISDFPVPTWPGTMQITQSIITLTAATPQLLIASNEFRLYLQWMVTGTNPATVIEGTGTPVVGNGMNYAGAFASGQPGGSQTWSGSTVPQDAFSAISAFGTTIVVWEGQ